MWMTAEDLALLREFVVRLGGAMTAAGDSVDSVNDRLRRIVDAYGFPGFEFFVLPTGMLVESGEASTASVLLSTDQQRIRYRFDQIAELYHLVGRAEQATVPPTEGLEELARIEAMEPGVRPGGPGARPRHPHRRARAAAATHPRRHGGGLRARAARRSPEAPTPRHPRPDLPRHRGLRRGRTVFAISHTGGVGDNPVRVLIPPLATFLPGGVLTIATVELAAGQMISGASRLVTGIVQLGLLAFGIVAAASLIGVDQEVLIDNPVDRLGPWAPWIGVLIIAIGDYLHFSAPARSLGWILVVLYVAYAGQAAGGALFGAR